MTISLSKTHPMEVYGTATGLMIVVTVPRRWWQVWRPRQIVVEVSRADTIYLYQAIYKHATKAMILE